MSGEYIASITDNCFMTYSEISGISFIVEVDDLGNVDKAKEIADREFGRWCEAEDETDDYWYQGYTEGVERALNNAGIAYSLYTKNEKEMEL